MILSKKMYLKIFLFNIVITRDTLGISKLYYGVLIVIWKEKMIEFYRIHETW